jgi:hypothetical protein
LKKILQLSSEERTGVFTEAIAVLGISPFYIEKDFWVCWVLERLFGHENIGVHLTFRGGTSLSKGWGLIDRFSEDVDLAMSRNWVDPDLPRPDEAGIKNPERDRRLQRLRRACRKTIRDELLPLLENEAADLGDGAKISLVDLDQARDPFVIEVQYPNGGLKVPGDYHRAVVKIELSGRADDWPQEPRPITPYVADALPQIERESEMMIACVTPARTFWEKAALLHERHAQVSTSTLGARQSRHLYDLVRLWEFVHDQEGLAELFEGVKLHRKTFFNYGRVDYDHLKPGDLVLAPPENQIGAWQSDYKAMRPCLAETRQHLIA